MDGRACLGWTVVTKVTSEVVGSAPKGGDVVEPEELALSGQLIVEGATAVQDLPPVVCPGREAGGVRHAQGL